PLLAPVTSATRELPAVAIISGDFVRNGHGRATLRALLDVAAIAISRDGRGCGNCNATSGAAVLRACCDGRALAHIDDVLARVFVAAVIGVDAVPVSVEVDVSPGLPGMTMVGLPDVIVRESRDRVRTAIRNSGFPFPGDRITVSLAPADVRKVGAAFDLP